MISHDDLTSMSDFRLEPWQPKPRGRRPYAARFRYRNSAGEIVAVYSRRRAYQGAKNLIARASKQLADDLREGEHVLEIEFVNWLDEPPDNIRRVNPPHERRPLIKLSQQMRAILRILDESTEDWVSFAKLRALMAADTESRETALHTTIKRLKEGHRRRRPLVETTLDGRGRLWVRAIEIADQ